MATCFRTARGSSVGKACKSCVVSRRAPAPPRARNLELTPTGYIVSARRYWLGPVFSAAVPPQMPAGKGGLLPSRTAFRVFFCDDF